MVMGSTASEVTTSRAGDRGAHGAASPGESDPPISLAPGLAESRSQPLIARYELLSELASGGMATIYAARTRGTAGFEQVVAIKTLHPHLRGERGLVEMFLDEARLAGRIHHPNVVAALDSGCDAHGHPFIAMEYVAGEQLGALLRSAGESGKRIAPQIVLRMVLDVLAGLSAAHALRDERGRSLELVHRDVSPQNILVGQDGCARLTDFGVARAEGRLHATRADVVKGKLAYMAPEQAAGRTLDQRADLFAMGVVLWEALTRRRLFAAEDSSEVFRRVLYDPIPRPSSVHASLAPLDPLLDRALARNPDERFASADEFARALEQTAHAIGGLAKHALVAKLVGRLAHDKLAAERARMQSAAASLERDVDERSETRKLTRADGFGRVLPEQAQVPALLAARRKMWRTSLRELTVPRWAGVGAALLLGALCTALFPAPAARVSPKLARAAASALATTQPEHRAPASTAAQARTAVPAARPAPVVPAVPAAPSSATPAAAPRDRQLKQSLPGLMRIPFRPGGPR
jgi:serine/threonine-protein kinase